tara:strand:- start:103 stop:285 length:183 start_codon:yes stop_codon:yes gene_type:complete
MTLKRIPAINEQYDYRFMSLESILMVVAPICLFTAGVVVLPILVKPRKQSGLPKRYIRGL